MWDTMHGMTRGVLATNNDNVMSQAHKTKELSYHCFLADVFAKDEHTKRNACQWDSCWKKVVWQGCCCVLFASGRHVLSQLSRNILLLFFSLKSNWNHTSVQCSLLTCLRQHNLKRCKWNVRTSSYRIIIRRVPTRALKSNGCQQTKLHATRTKQHSFSYNRHLVHSSAPLCDARTSLVIECGHGNSRCNREGTNSTHSIWLPFRDKRRGDGLISLWHALEGPWFPYDHGRLATEAEGVPKPKTLIPAKNFTTMTSSFFPTFYFFGLSIKRKGGIFIWNKRHPHASSEQNNLLSYEKGARPLQSHEMAMILNDKLRRYLFKVQSHEGKRGRYN